MSKEIFNQEALSRLRSPEELDKVIQVTQPVAWMALVTLFILAASIVVWSIFGVMSVSVDSVGMILDPAGVVNIYHDTSGKISEVLARPGNRVRKGDVVAKLALPAMMNDIIKTRQDIMRSTNQDQVEGGVSQFDSLMNVWYYSFNVVSTFDGIVTEVKVNVGDVVSPGSTSICSIRLDQNRQDMIAVMYVPAESGKKIEPGMVARLAPSGADQQEDGSLMGVVRRVSLYPASTNGIMKTLGNSDVVNWIMQKMGGAVMEVRIDLVKDSKSPSGYLWSSSVGKHRPITVGTICTGSIVTDRQPPLGRIFKKLSQWLRNT
ncbi:MAG: HlyD family efflux transporter periplasmic adaptor subunit [Synergistaceae bacterium]|jgi:multidrug efflux pump subunit AcrA (membrane-fusion protein)|nr:HlyD family efflux transporter periplasmic adaptor subunit [Synergistaceae bacterium]